MSDEKMRAEFEAEITKDRMDAGYDEPNLGMHEWEGAQCYVETHIQAAWWGWQASRATLVVELPKQYDIGGLACDAHDRAVAWCSDAIEAAGVKVKP